MRPARPTAILVRATTPEAASRSSAPL